MNKFQSLLKSIAWVSSFICMISGIVALSIYHLLAYIAFPTFPNYAPVYITCWCFLLSGIALASLMKDKSWIHRSVGIILFILSVGFFFDPLLINILSISSAKTHVSTLANLDLFLISAVFIFSSKNKITALPHFFSAFASFVIFFLTLGAFAALLYPEESHYLLNEAPNIKLATSILLTILSVGLLSRVLYYMNQTASFRRLRIAFFSFTFFVIIAGMFSFAIKAEHQVSLSRLFIQDSEEIKNKIEQALQNEIKSLLILNEVFAPLDSSKKSRWIESANLYVQNHPEWISLQTFNDQFQVQIVLPEQKGGVLTSAFILPEFLKKDVKTKTTQSVFFTTYPSIEEKKTNLILFCPSWENGVFQGGIATLIDFNMFLSSLLYLSEFLENYSIKILEHGQIVFSMDSIKNDIVKKWETTNHWSFYDLDWTVIIAPNNEYYQKESQNFVFWISIIGGFVISLSIGCLAYLWQNSQNQVLYIQEIQNKLKESKDSLDLAVTSAGIGLWHWDVKNDIMFFDNALLRLFGIAKRPDTINFAQVLDWIYPEDRDAVEKALRQSLETGVPFKVDHRVLWPDGSMHFISAKGRTYLENGQPSTMAGAAWDTTELHNAVEHLNKSEEKFRSFIEATEEWIWEVDAKRKITYSNPSIRLILGYSPEELMGTDYTLLLVDRFREECERLFERNIAKKVGFINRTIMWEHKNGGFRWIETNSTPVLSEHGEVTGFRAASRDVTERKNLEELKTEFVSNVSHELRTPLTSIYGSLGLLIGKYQNECPEKIRSLLDIAYRNSERLLQLINQLLDVQKMASGKIEFHLKPFSISDVIQEAIKISEPIAKKAGVLVELVQPLTTSKVKADFEHLIEVMLNLISNAVKFSPPQGKITISSVDNDSMIRVSVKDEGQGIPEEFKPRIFERFAQATLSKKVPGAGLGLSICKNIIEAMGGTINFISEKGKGTTFYFDLPKQ